MTEFLLIRHGETDWNRELRFQGQIDVPLNAMGQVQAQRLADHLAQSEWSDALHLHSSDLQRAMQTAQPLSGERRHLQAHKGLREQGFGIFEGLSVTELQSQQPELWQQWRRFDAGFELPGGESTQRFHGRVMQSLSALAEEHWGERLVVVTHGGVLNMVWRTVHGQSLHGYRECVIPNAGVNHVAWEDGRWRVLSWAKVDHLLGLPPQPVYQTTSV
ncbi:MAG: histidine phosphatase family protein [Alphaproteobacteria bacterium]|nr:histidine phosphatase family protein [Alphaproteobacteria bacterium]